MILRGPRPGECLLRSPPSGAGRPIAVKAARPLLSMGFRSVNFGGPFGGTGMGRRRGQETRMTAVQDRVGGCRLSARYSLPAHVLTALERRFSAWRVEYIARALSADKLAVIANLDDALIIARI